MRYLREIQITRFPKIKPQLLVVTNVDNATIFRDEMFGKYVSVNVNKNELFGSLSIDPI